MNAVATGAVLPLPLWWLLTRRRSPARRDLLLAWCPARARRDRLVARPAGVLGRYSPPFLDWIETAAVDHVPGVASSAFRGTTQWVAWLRLPDPVWPAGWARDRLAGRSRCSPGAGRGSAVAGLLRAAMPHRSFLLGGVSAASCCSPSATSVRSRRPGRRRSRRSWTAPARRCGTPTSSTWSLRLPLCLALAHALSVIRVPAVKGMPWTRRGLVFTAACAVLGHRLARAWRAAAGERQLPRVPGYWSAAADWLAANDDGGSHPARSPARPSPRASGATRTTSRSRPLARTPWAVRSAVPLSSAGNIRVLNAVEAQLATGRGSPGLAEFLARAGITRLLVRADLAADGTAGSTPRALTVRAALLDSPGLTPVQRFGPTLGGDSTQRFAWDGGLDLAVPALEVWQVDHPSGLAQVYPAGSLLRVSGTPESLLPLAASGALADRPVVLDGDPDSVPAPAGSWALTDTPLRREASFAQVRRIYGPVLTADEPYVTDRAAHDWMPFDRPLVTMLPDGVRQVVTSSDASFAENGWQAFDGDGSTTWTSGAFAQGQYVQVDLPAAVELPARLPVTFGTSGVRVAAVTVSTDRGRVRTELPADSLLGRTAQVEVPRGSTTRIRFTVTSIWSGQDLGQVSIAEIGLGGIRPRRPLVVPSTATEKAAPELISLQAVDPAADGCAFVGDRSWCAPTLAGSGAERTVDRFVDLPRGDAYTVTATARPRPGSAVEQLLRPAGTPEVTASSRYTPEVAQRPQAVFDDDLATTWLASTTDTSPRLSLSWDGERRISSLRWFVASEVFVSRPTTLAVTVGGSTRTVRVDEDGWARFAPLTGTTLVVTVKGTAAVPTRDPVLGLTTIQPIGLTELIVPGLDDLRRGMPDSTPVSLGCGRGPALLVGDTEVETRISGTAGQVLRREPMSVTPCPDQVRLGTGLTRIRLDDNRLVVPQGLLLRRAAVPPPAALPVTRPTRVEQLSTEHRRITVAAGTEPQLLVVHENANPGWRATLDGRPLSSVRVDGWQQAWLVPAAGGEVDLLFARAGPTGSGWCSGCLVLVGLAVVAIGREPARARPGAPARPRRADRGRPRRTALHPARDGRGARDGWGLGGRAAGRRVPAGPAPAGLAEHRRGAGLRDRRRRRRRSPPGPTTWACWPAPGRSAGWSCWRFSWSGWTWTASAEPAPGARLLGPVGRHRRGVGARVRGSGALRGHRAGHRRRVGRGDRVRARPGPGPGPGPSRTGCGCADAGSSAPMSPDGSAIGRDGGVSGGANPGTTARGRRAPAATGSGTAGSGVAGSGVAGPGWRGRPGGRRAARGPSAASARSSPGCADCSRSFGISAATWVVTPRRKRLPGDRDGGAGGRPGRRGLVGWGPWAAGPGAVWRSIDQVGLVVIRARHLVARFFDPGLRDLGAGVGVDDGDSSVGRSAASPLPGRPRWLRRPG